MFAILISPENEQKILKHYDSIPHQPLLNLDVYFESARTWYYVSGWYKAGSVLPAVILPEYMLVENFEFDPDKIKTDWDQIVRR